MDNKCSKRKGTRIFQGWSEFREEGEQGISQEDANILLKLKTTPNLC